MPTLQLWVKLCGHQQNLPLLAKAERETAVRKLAADWLWWPRSWNGGVKVKRPVHLRVPTHIYVVVMFWKTVAHECQLLFYTITLNINMSGSGYCGSPLMQVKGWYSTMYNDIWNWENSHNINFLLYCGLLWPVYLEHQPKPACREWPW